MSTSTEELTSNYSTQQIEEAADKIGVNLPKEFGKYVLDKLTTQQLELLFANLQNDSKSHKDTGPWNLKPRTEVEGAHVKKDEYAQITRMVAEEDMSAFKNILRLAGLDESLTPNLILLNEDYFEKFYLTFIYNLLPSVKIIDVNAGAGEAELRLSNLPVSLRENKDFVDRLWKDIQRLATTNDQINGLLGKRCEELSRAPERLEEIAETLEIIEEYIKSKRIMSAIEFIKKIQKQIERYVQIEEEYEKYFPDYKKQRVDFVSSRITGLNRIITSINSLIEKPNNYLSRLSEKGYITRQITDFVSIFNQLVDSLKKISPGNQALLDLSQISLEGLILPFPI